MFCDRLKEGVLVSSEAPIADTPKGKIAGLKKGDTYIFRGIKYANTRRFHMPEPIDSWEGVKSAVTYGYVCPELTTPIPDDAQVDPHYYMPQDEDCQYLNIWTQSLEPEAKKPVMVWMHGGGWFGGSSVEQYAYDGEELSKFGDVVVSFNHRLNCLSGLDLSEYGEEYRQSSCCGFADILLLLRWVKENIGAFGGDAQNVMVFGQSGGVSKILCAMQCPEADGLFQKAAIDSGGIKEQEIPCGWTKRRLAQRLTALVVEELRLNQETIHEIEKVPYWDLAAAALNAQDRLNRETGLTGSYRWEPVEDGSFLIGNTLHDGFRPETKQIPMMIGNVFGEGRSNLFERNQFAEQNENPDLQSNPNRISESDARTGQKRVYLHKNQWSEAQTLRHCRERWGERADEILQEFRRVYPENNPADVLFMDAWERNGQLGLVEKRITIGADVWNWLFKKESAIGGGTVAWHCSELPYVFHNTSYIEAAFEPGVSEQLEEIICSAWVNMARHGDPNGGNVPQWDKVSTEDTPTMIFDRNCGQRVNHDQRLRELLRD
ncbi:MAG: carboxylesterase family protein [Lachnospiraceae bacterium]|nr:carboxylesterase family protein [Lachnospiraceae bacterium]